MFMKWIWEAEDWPNMAFSEDLHRVDTTEIMTRASRLHGRLEGLLSAPLKESLAGLVVSETVNTSALDGVNLDKEAVTISLRALAGQGAPSVIDPSRGVLRILISIVDNWNQPLSYNLLSHWHSLISTPSKQNSFARTRYREDDLIIGSDDCENPDSPPFYYVGPPC